MICYDISEPKRLRKTAKVLESYGIRIQKSIFQLDIDADMLKNLVRDVLAVIDKKLDAFFIYPLCDVCTRNALCDGEGEIVQVKAFEIL